MSRHERLCALLLSDKHVKRRDVRAILNESSAESLDLNAIDARGWPPLATAARRGHVEIVKLLLRHGASLQSCTEPGRNTAAHVAAIFGRPDVLFALQRAARHADARIDIMNGIVNRDRLTAAQLLDQAESRQRRADAARRHAKRSRSEQAQMHESDAEDEAWWREKLMAESHMADAAGDWREAAFDARAKSSSLDAMDDDQYAAHIRAQMRKRLDAAAARVADDAAQRRRASASAKRDAEREARARLDEREATEREARAKKRRVARAAEFEEQWTAFVARVQSADAGSNRLRLRDIPWPCDADVYELAEADEARGGRVALLEERLAEHFGGGGVSAGEETTRQTLRAQLLRWHPDKFSQKFGRLLDARDADLVLARVKLIAQCLTQMLSRLSDAPA